MSWSRPVVPVPLLSLPRATELTMLYDRVAVDLNDGRRIVVRFDYCQRLDEATVEQQQRVFVTQYGLVLCWPDLNLNISIRRLLMNAKARYAPWGDPPEIVE